MADCVDWVGLSLVPGVGSVLFWRLVDHFGDPSKVLNATRQQLQSVPGVQKRYLSGLTSSDAYRQKAEAELKQLVKIGGETLIFSDPNYPDLLRQISDPPPVLYMSGDKDALNHQSVAIVGSRAATSYGSRVSNSLAKHLADYNYSIVSGLAMGVDREAHAGALAANGKTVAILGCGLDIIYPRQNKELYSAIRTSGTLVTEYPLGTRPDGFRFPARNRIIAGMSLGVVVVEAARKSGSLITAQLALDEGREVFAVPGQVDSFKSAGTHWLLQQGAKLVQTADDVVEELQPVWSMRSTGKETNAAEKIKNLDPDAILLLEYVDSYPSPREDLVEKVGLPIWRVSELLLLLELEGLIEILPGDELRRIAIA